MYYPFTKLPIYPYTFTFRYNQIFNAISDKTKMNNIQIKTLEPSYNPAWDEYVYSSLKTTFCHLIGWKNVIEKIYKINYFKIFLKQFKSFLIYILLIAAVISFTLAFYYKTEHYIDGIVILSIVLLNFYTLRFL